MDKAEREKIMARLHSDAQAGSPALDGKMTGEIAQMYGLGMPYVLKVLLPLRGEENEAGSILAASEMRFDPSAREWRPCETIRKPGTRWMHYHFFYT